MNRATIKQIARNTVTLTFTNIADEAITLEFGAYGGYVYLEPYRAPASPVIECFGYEYPQGGDNGKIKNKSDSSFPRFFMQATPDTLKSVIQSEWKRARTRMLNEYFVD